MINVLAIIIIPSYLCVANINQWRARCRYKSPGQGREIMISNEVRIVNSNQENGKVIFHLVNGKTVVRTMCASEIIMANTIGNRDGADARIAEYVRLFNERYSEPQKIT